MAGIILWTLIGFACGSLPFSYWVGRLLARKDIRQVGDGNPGAANAWKAGGWHVGVLAAILDVAKGYVPVTLALASGLAGFALLPVALAPVVGHAASPFLGFRGGKALAVTGGVWLALIGGAAALAFAPFALLALALQVENAWSGVSGVAGLLLYSVVGAEGPYLFCIALGNLAILVWKHRRELRQPLQLRGWAANLLGRRQS